MHLWRIFLLSVLLLPSGGPGGKPETQQQYFFTRAQAFEVMREFLDAIRLDRPENLSLPSYVRERLAWANSASAAGTLQVNLWDKCEGCSANDLMGMNFRNGRFELDVYAPRLLRLMWDEQRQELHRKPEKRAVNTFLLAVVHETIHMERGSAYYLSLPSAEERFREEVRAWAITVLNAVRPLRAQLQPLDEDWVKADDILAACGDDPACGGFQGFVRAKIK
jgi:hypothetical protein